MKFGIGSPLAMAAICACSANLALAAGFFNLPSNSRQYLGVGFGPGYHAPMVLGPAVYARAERQGVLRMPMAPQPPFGSHVDFGATALEPPYPPQPAFDSQPWGSLTPGPTLAPPQGESVLAPVPLPMPAVPWQRPEAAVPREPASPSDRPAPEPLPLPRA